MDAETSLVERGYSSSASSESSGRITRSDEKPMGAFCSTLQQRRLAGCARRTESRGFHHDLECLRRTSGVCNWSMDALFFISRARMGRTLFHLPCQDGEFNREELFSSGSEAACSFARISVAALSLASSTAISPVSVSIFVEHSLIIAFSSMIS